MKIVLAGGPVAGKTDVIKALSEVSSVDVVAEIATALMSVKISPTLGKEIRVDDDVLRSFEAIVAACQIGAEDLWYRVARLNAKKALVLDRGLPDIYAYWPGDREEVEAALSLTHQKILARYDAVIMLESVAMFDRALYDQLRDSNPCRIESADEAIKKQQLTEQAWSDHPNLIKIGGRGGIDSVVAQVSKQIESLCSQEIERKFLLLAQPKLSPGSEIHQAVIQQGYIQLNDSELRLRSTITDDGVEQKSLTLKSGSGLVRSEWEDDHVALGTFELLWQMTEGCRVNKTRSFFWHEDNLLEVDCYLEGGKKHWVLECEFASVEKANQFQLPSWAKDAIEVTDDSNYRASSIAKCGFPAA